MGVNILPTFVVYVELVIFTALPPDGVNYKHFMTFYDELHVLNNISEYFGSEPIFLFDWVDHLLLQNVYYVHSLIYIFPTYSLKICATLV